MINHPLLYRATQKILQLKHKIQILLSFKKIYLSFINLCKQFGIVKKFIFRNRQPIQIL